jgi:hypothetical protein
MFSNINKPKAPKTERPVNHADKLKRLALGALAASSMNVMDIGKAAFAADPVAPTLEIAIEHKQLDLKDTTSIPNSFLTDEVNFKHSDIEVNGNIKSFNVFAPNGNRILIDSTKSSDVSINGVQVKKYKSAEFGNTIDLSQGGRFVRYNSQVDRNFDGQKEFKEHKDLKWDFSNPAILKLTYEDCNGFGLARDKEPMLKNGTLDGFAQSIQHFHLPKGKKILPQIKTLKVGTLVVEDIDSLAGSNITFEHATVEFYFPKNLIVNYLQLKKLMAKSKGTLFVIHEDGMANASGDEGTTYTRFADQVLADNTIEYSKYVKEHNLGSGLSGPKANTSNEENVLEDLKRGEGIGWYETLFMTEAQIKAKPELFSKSTSKQSIQKNTVETKTEAKIVSANKNADYVPGGAPAAAAAPVASNKVADYVPGAESPAPRVEQAAASFPVRFEADTRWLKMGPLDMSQTAKMLASQGADQLGYSVSVNGGPDVRVFKTDKLMGTLIHIDFSSLKRGDTITMKQEIYKGDQRIFDKNQTINTFTAR